MDTAFITFIQCPIGWEELTGGQPFRIYPNPVGEVVTIESLDPAETRYAIELLDLRGEMLIRSVATDSRTEVNLSGIPSGLYLVQITWKTTVYRFRLIRK